MALDLKLDDLIVKCTKCGGTGTFTEEHRSGGGVGMHGLISTGPCDACGNHGAKLTPDGEVLLQFVRQLRERHFVSF